MQKTHSLLEKHSSNKPSFCRRFFLFCYRSQAQNVAHYYIPENAATPTSPLRPPFTPFFSAACVIMESDLGSFSEHCDEEVENFLKAIGVAPRSVPAADENASTSPDATTTKVAPNLSVEPSSNPSRATEAGSVERQWLGTDVSAVSTLVVLVTAICR